MTLSYITLALNFLLLLQHYGFHLWPPTKCFCSISQWCPNYPKQWILLILYFSVEFDIVDDPLILKTLCSLAFWDTIYSLFFSSPFLFISFEVFPPLHNPSNWYFLMPTDSLSLHGLSEIAHLTLGLQPPSACWNRALTKCCIRISKLVCPNLNSLSYLHPKAVSALVVLILVHGVTIHPNILI